MDLNPVKNRVIEFIQSQPGYDLIKQETVKVSWSDTDHFYILVGEDLQIGIGGFGDTPELAFDDFVSSWHHFKGAEWIIKNK